LRETGVTLRLGVAATAEVLRAGGFEDVVVATGVTPRDPGIPGQDHPMVMGYVDALTGARAVGRRVAVIGAGGIGFDVSEFLSHDGPPTALDRDAWRREWGVGDPAAARGGVAGVRSQPSPPAREVFLLQRKVGKPGAGLGKTTGWIHRTALKMKKVQMIAGARYDLIDDAGLHVTVGDERRTLAVDSVVLCTGQEPRRDLLAPLQAAGLRAHLVGGAEVAAELDAKRAIRDATLLATRL
jgi:2,4-dienoyl-CoA reductase (NADPH2)